MCRRLRRTFAPEVEGEGELVMVVLGVVDVDAMSVVRSFVCFTPVRCTA